MSHSVSTLDRYFEFTGGEMCTKFSVETPKKKGQLGRYRSRWEDNINMDSKDIECEGVDWIYLAQDRDRWRALVNTVMNFVVP
jgi:hypothetical protein